MESVVVVIRLTRIRLFDLFQIGINFETTSPWGVL